MWRARWPHARPHCERPTNVLAPAAAPDPELDAVLLHVLNHCAKAADRVRKNNERLKAAGKGKGGGDEGAEEPPRDQGFVRPKVGRRCMLCVARLPCTTALWRSVRCCWWCPCSRDTGPLAEL